MSIATALPSEAPEPREPPFSPAIVEEMLRQLDKTVRAHQLYMHNNPTYLRAVEALRASFAPLWAETDSLTLGVNDLKFTWCDVSVHEHPDRTSDSLPWTFYKDGLREVTFTSGLEGPELEMLLDIVPRARKAAAHEDDLITMLWEQEFAHLTYRFVEVADDGAAIEAGAEPGRWPEAPDHPADDPRRAVDGARENEAAGATDEPVAAFVNPADFDSTLYFLDADDVAYLRKETEQEYATDHRRIVLAALLDVFELQSDPAIRAEVTQHLDALTLHLLAGGQFSSVAFLLREIATVIGRAKELTPEARDRLASLPDRLSEPASLSQLLAAMDEADPLPPQADLEELFSQLRAAALATIFAQLGSVQNPKLRPLLASAAERLSQSNTTEVVRLISSAEVGVAVEAVKHAGALRTAAAVPALGKVLGEKSRDLRLAAVAALASIGTPGAMQALEKALDEDDRDIRVAAVKALAQGAYRPAFAKVAALLRSNRIREADRTERLALFELYGALCGDAGVPWLDEVLNDRGGLFARKADPELRACAALALGKVNTQRSLQALQKAMSEKDVLVRNAVNRALKGGAA